MKKEYLLGAGLVGAAIGFMIGTNITLKKCKETINKDVKEAINKEVKNNVIQELDIKDLRKDIKEEATKRVVDSIEQKTDKKLKEFNERLEAMEDIDAKKLDLGKAAVVGVVTIATTLIKACYDNKNKTNDDVVSKMATLLDKKFEVCDTNFIEIDGRLNALEVK